MHRSVLIAALLVLAAGCASAPVAVHVAATPAGSRVTTEEIDCMSECLSSDDEDCESCVKECLTPTSDSIAALAAKQ